MNCRLVFSCLKISLFLGVLASLPVRAARLPYDSTGVERRDGTVYVLHRVDRGQTLYSILKRYGALFAEYKAANPGAADAVQLDQLLRVPYNRGRAMNPEQSAVPELAKTTPRVETPRVETPRSESPERTTPETKPTERPRAGSSVSPRSEPAAPRPTAARPATHEVQPGETLYSIARRYGLAVDDVKHWNNLPDAGGVHAGQVLVLNGEAVPKKPTKTAEEIAREQLKTVPEPKPAPKTVSTLPLPIRTDGPKAEPAKAEEAATKRPAEPTEEEPVAESRPAAVPNLSATARHRRETGLAEVIAVDDKSGRYLGLHRTAPVGTMVTVRNEANGQVVMVKIIGKLPDTGLNDRVIIKLSPGAFSRLSPVDRRFRAEISFVMP